MVNVAKLNEAVRFCRDNPESHNQKVWTCKTAACLFGNVVLLNGYRVLSEHYPYSNCLGALVAPQALPLDADLYVTPDDLRIVRRLAVEILDIDADDAIILSDADNTIDTLELMAKDLANGEHLDDLWQENSQGKYVRRDEA